MWLPYPLRPYWLRLLIGLSLYTFGIFLVLFLAVVVFGL